MRKIFYVAILALFCCSCGEYSKVLKSRDANYKFEYAKKAFDQKKYLQAATVLTDIITPLRGTPNGEEALYLLAMSHYENKDYDNAAVYFKNYYQRYPKGKFAELAHFYSGYGFYLNSPEPQLDQSSTIHAMEELQSFIDYYPKSDRVTVAQNAIFEMQDKLTLKELQNAQLYYNLGNYLGNNYEACVITSKNAIKNYPYSKYKEDFEMLILKSKFQEAQLSVNERKEDRYREVLDEYYSFINNYPESKNRQEADNIMKVAKRHIP